MGKYIIAVLLLVGVGLGYGIVTAEPGGSLYSLKNWMSGASYTAAVSDGIDLLEEQLADLEVKLAAGELSDDEAYELKEKLVKRVDTLNNSIQNSKNRQLTADEKIAVAASLERLKGALEKYRDSLIALETKAKKSKRHSGGGGGKSIVDVVEDAVEDFEEYVEEVVEEYESEEEEENTDDSESDDGESEEENESEESEDESEDDEKEGDEEDGEGEDTASSTEEVEEEETP